MRIKIYLAYKLLKNIKMIIFLSDLSIIFNHYLIKFGLNIVDLWQIFRAFIKKKYHTEEQRSYILQLFN